jgi:hypothetical protein
VLAESMEGLHMQQGCDARHLAVSSSVQHAVGLQVTSDRAGQQDTAICAEVCTTATATCAELTSIQKPSQVAASNLSPVQAPGSSDPDLQLS